MNRSAPRPSRIRACSANAPPSCSPPGPIDPPMKTSRPVISRASRASFTPAELICSKSSSRKCWRQLVPVRPERVRLDQLGAGVDEAEVQRDDGLGRAEVRLLGAAQARDGRGEHDPHAAVGDDRGPGAQAVGEAPGHESERNQAMRSSTERGMDQADPGALQCGRHLSRARCGGALPGRRNSERRRQRRRRLSGF